MTREHTPYGIGLVTYYHKRVRSFFLYEYPAHISIYTKYFILPICTLSNSYALRILGGTSLSVLTIATIIPSLMLLFRRWRDAGLTGKAILLFIVLLLCAGSISAFYPRFGGAVSYLFIGGDLITY